MKFEIIPTNGKQDRFELNVEKEGTDQSMGFIALDSNDNQWKAQGPVLLCLELLTSNSQWRQGCLGEDFRKASLIVLEVLGAWALLTSDSMADKSIRIHKLDIPVDNEDSGTVDIYHEFRPLVEKQIASVG